MTDAAPQENLASRIRQTRAQVDAFLSAARPRKGRLVNTTIVAGTLAAALTAAPAAGGQAFTTWLTAALHLPTPSWRLLCVAASICSITSAIATQLLKSNSLEENVSRAQRTRAKLDALEMALTVGQLNSGYAAEQYFQCVEETALLNL
jgi:hypothetical protein